MNAGLPQMSGQLGCIQPDACADLPAPLKDPGFFRDPLANFVLIMKGGVCIRSALYKRLTYEGSSAAGLSSGRFGAGG